MSLWKCNACGGTYDDTQRDGTVYMHACAPLPPDSKGAQAELPNKRDESILLAPGWRARDITAPGAGVTPLQGQATTEPQWILDMRAEHLKRTATAV